MDGRRFDNLTRSLAHGYSRRVALKAAAAGLLAALAGRAPADAQVSQSYCGNVVCGSNPGVCNPGCVCCVYPNGNSRCRPPQECTGTIVSPTTTTTTSAPTTSSTTTTTETPTTTTTTQAPTTSTTTTTAAPTCNGDCSPGLQEYCSEGCVCDALFSGTCIDQDSDGCGGACRYNTVCPAGCVCNGYPSGTCAKADANGCGGGCAPSDGVFCPSTCVCNHIDDGLCVLRAADGCGEACHPLQGVPCVGDCVCNAVTTGTCIRPGPGGCGGACSAHIACPPTCVCQDGTCVLRGS